MPLIEGSRPPIGCTRRWAVAKDELLSLEEGHPSMGKMAGPGRHRGPGGARLGLQSRLKCDHLRVRQGMEKGL